MYKQYPKAYIEYLVYFHGQRDYFECHEVLEEEWKKDARGNRKTYWVGLIQLAVGLYHQRIGNFKGAKKLIKNSISIIEQEQTAIKQLGIDYTVLLAELRKRYLDIKNNIIYKSFSIPLLDKDLLNRCEEICQSTGCKWGQPSDLANKEILYKHKLRDRTEVIEEREKQIKKKTENNNFGK